MFYVNEREAKFANSPFAQYAKSEGFGLWAVSSSYFILKAIVNSEHNYFELAENDCVEEWKPAKKITAKF